jgi:hypothetical protein
MPIGLTETVTGGRTASTHHDHIRRWSLNELRSGRGADLDAAVELIWHRSETPTRSRGDTSPFTTISTNCWPESTRCANATRCGRNASPSSVTNTQKESITHEHIDDTPPDGLARIISADPPAAGRRHSPPRPIDARDESAQSTDELIRLSPIHRRRLTARSRLPTAAT